jgi:hypothetical protein
LHELTQIVPKACRKNNWAQSAFISVNQRFKSSNWLFLTRFGQNHDFVAASIRVIRAEPAQNPSDN